MIGALALAAVIVQPGQTLSGIASAHGVSLAAVETANPQIANPDLIYVNESVSLPGSQVQVSQVPQSQAPRPQASSPAASSSSLSSVPGVPASFAACVAFRESGNGTNQAYNGGVYGIITASGINVNGQSLAAQKAAFSKLYAQYGTAPWTPSDGCTV